MNEKMLEEGVKAVVHVFKALLCTCRGRMISISRARIVELYLGTVIRKKRVREYLNRVSTCLTSHDNKRLAMYVQIVLDKLVDELDLLVYKKTSRIRIYIMQRGSLIWHIFETLPESHLVQVLKTAILEKRPLLPLLVHRLKMCRIANLVLRLGNGLTHVELCRNLVDEDKLEKCTREYALRVIR